MSWQNNTQIHYHHRKHQPTLTLYNTDLQGRRDSIQDEHLSQRGMHGLSQIVTIVEVATQPREKIAQHMVNSVTHVRNGTITKRVADQHSSTMAHRDIGNLSIN
ncbi:unnamed protein product [Lota lota]